MRINQLQVKNIASLKGKHHIDFDNITSHSSLFAITGATGSGKSTLLNCVSLALYSKVYKEGISSIDYVTIGEAEAEIELWFTQGTRQYKSHWKIRTAKANGDPLKTPQLSKVLYQIEDQQETAIETPIEQILKLNFNQFCKTSILNQGEFSRFLKSNFTERKEILAKFYEGEDLSLLNSKLREKMTLLKSEIDSLDNQIKGIEDSQKDIIVDEQELLQRKEKVDWLSEIKKDLFELANYLADTNKYLTQLSDTKIKTRSTNHKVSTIQQELNEIKERYSQLSEELSKSEAQLKQKRGPLQESISKEQSKKSLALKLEQNSDRLKRLQKKIDELKEDHYKLEKAKKQLEHQNTKALASFPQITKAPFETHYESYQKMKSSLEKTNQAEENLSEAQLKVKKLTEQLTKNKAEMLEAEDFLKKNQIEKIKSQLSPLEQTLTELTIFNDVFIKNHEKWLEHNKQLETLKETLKNEEVALQKLYEQESDLINQKKSLDEAVLTLNKEYSLTTCLHETIKAKHCVVCDQHLPDIEILQTKYETLKNQQQQNLEKDVSQNIQLTEEINKKINDQKIKLIALRDKNQTISVSQQQLNSETLLKWNKLDLPYSENILQKKNLDVIKAAIKNKVSQITELKNRIDQYHINDQKLSHLKKQQALDASHEQELKLKIKSWQQEQIEAKHERRKIMHSYGLKGDDNEGVILLKRISENAKDYYHTKTEVENHKQSLANSEATRKREEEIASQVKQEIAELKDDLAQIEKFIQENTSQGNPQSELKALEDSHSHLKIKFEEVDENKRNSSIKLAELQSMLNSYQEQTDNLNKQLALLGLKIKEYLNIILQNNNFTLEQNLLDCLQGFKAWDFEQLPTTEIFESSFKTFEKRRSEFTESFEKESKEYTELNILWLRLKDNLKKIESLSSIKKQKSEQLNQYENLNILIGKDEFRNYVLSIIENLLIDQTNQELNKLCDGRYRIIQTHKTNRTLSEFRIIDHFHGGHIRKVNSLSGGETFLVSLALALALAEMTRGQTQIDSLFIDEGFGTLDSESIEDAYNLLLDIQSSGKLIGIISHVRNLTNRIPVNINLLKGSDGLSSVEVHMN